VAPIETPPGEDQTARPTEAETTVTRVRRRGRFVELEPHELITLLDEVDDERAKARFRESIYISVIVWLIFGWVIIYGPRYLWHPPVIINAPDEKRTNMTYLDTPPDLQKQLKRIKPAPNVSQHDTEAQSPKPSPQAPEPKAGTPAPPAPKPQPQQQAQQPAPQQQPQPQPQQQARNTPPTPTPPQPHPQPVPDAPSAQPNRNIFGGQGSAGQQIQQATHGARDSGDYGSTGRGQQGGAKQGFEILSDTQGVDFGKYLARLLSDVRRNWLPLIPEECRPPLNKQGITGVRFTILPDGKIAPGSMHLDYSTHDDAINRAAWGSITGLGQAQPLPKEFKGPNLELRIEFRINKDAPDAQ
jgi:outer membrane biosynthesis protein TonB